MYRYVAVDVFTDTPLEGNLTASAELPFAGHPVLGAAFGRPEPAAA